jgi:hypothetical protein
MNLSPQEQQVLRDMIASARVEEVISLLEELSATRKAQICRRQGPDSRRGFE